VEYAYDAANNLQCTAVRMNSAYFANPGTPACQLSTPGATAPNNMPDQITYDTHDAANQLIKVTQGYGTPAQADYVTATYWPNGHVASVTDAQNNMTNYSYDGHDRLSQTCFPLPTQGAGACDPGNIETYLYNSTNTLAQKTLRDGTPVKYFYDNLNRVTQKDFHNTPNFDVTYNYDNLSRLLYAHSGGAGVGVDYAYDGLSRVVSETRSGLR